MNRSIMTLVSVALTAAAAGAAEAPKLDPNGAYVIKLERPFGAKEAVPEWLPLRIAVTLKDGKPASAVAFAHQFNTAWHTVDVSRLACAGSRFSGTIGVGLRWDDIQRSVKDSAADERFRRQYNLPWKDGSVQQFTLEIPITEGPAGNATGKAAWTADVLNARDKGREVSARAWPQSPLDAKKPIYLEFTLGSWAPPGLRTKQEHCRYGIMDAMPEGACLLLRCTIRDGKAGDWIVFQAPERYAMHTADLIWTVREAAVTLDGNTLRGSLTLVANVDRIVGDQRSKTTIGEMCGKNSKFMPLPKEPVQLRVTASLIGRTLSGQAEVSLGAQTHRSDVYGQTRPYPFAVHADRAPREWKYTRQADAKLVEAARKEASIPIRPGEPGKRDFWTEYAIMGGCDFRGVKDGKRMVQTGPILRTYEEFRQSRFKREWPLSCIAAPSFNLPEVSGAARYRFSLVPEGAREALTFEADKPWRPLAPVWDRVPPGQVKLRVVGLDAGGKEIGAAAQLAFAKRPSFDGPYFDAPRTLREAALMHARWMRDNPRNGLGRGIYYEPVGGARGDGQLWFITYSGAWGGLIVHALATDPIERADALDAAAMVAGDLWLRSFSQNFLPDTYKGWVFDQWVYGTTWLDLYRITGEQKYADAVKLQVERIARHQLPSGTWMNVEPSGSGEPPKPDPKTGLYVHQIGPWPTNPDTGNPCEFDPASILYFLGRVRQELKTDDFRSVEDKTWKWLQDNSIARFDWRKQGPMESSHTNLPWPTVADYALHCFEYLALDLPGREPDLTLMVDLLRWCEDRAVDWRRVSGGNAVFPQADGCNDVTLRLALAYARLAERTKDPLHRAKAEALAHAALIAQNPASGQIVAKGTFETAPGRQGIGDGGWRGEYGCMALFRLAQMWEGMKEQR
jgi:hypothetical protein